MKKVQLYYRKDQANIVLGTAHARTCKEARQNYIQRMTDQADKFPLTVRATLRKIGESFNPHSLFATFIK